MIKVSVLNDGTLRTGSIELLEGPGLKWIDVQRTDAEEMQGLGRAMDGYLSMVANPTSDITKQLTIFSTIFLPLSFITGFFGQNFEILSQREFFWTMLALVFGLPLGLVRWFRHKQWI